MIKVYFNKFIKSFKNIDFYCFFYGLMSFFIDVYYEVLLKCLNDIWKFYGYFFVKLSWKI